MGIKINDKINTPYGLELVGAYLKLNSMSIEKENGVWIGRFNFSVFINKEERDKNMAPILGGNGKFVADAEVNSFIKAYQEIKKNYSNFEDVI